MPYAKKTETGSRINWVFSEYGALLVITIIAAVLRLYKLGTWNYFIDELHTLNNSLDIRSFSLVQPFFSMTKVSLDTLGIGKVSLRLIPSVVGILTVPVLYFPIKRLFDARVALLASLFLAISPWHIYQSQFARWYSLLFLVSALSLLCFYWFIEHKSYMYLGLHVVLLVFAYFLHLTALFIVMIDVAYVSLLVLFPQWRPPSFSSRQIKILLGVFIAGALAVVPKVVHFLGHWQHVREALGGHWGTTPQKFFLMVSYHVTPTIVVLSVVGIVLLVGNRMREGIFLGAYSLFPVLALMGVAGAGENVSARYAFFTLPAILMAASYACVYVVDSTPWKARAVMWGIVLACMMPSLQAAYLYYGQGYGHRDRLDEAIAYLKERVGETDRIVIITGGAYARDALFNFKMNARVAGWEIADEQLSIPSDGKTDGMERIWVVGRNHNLGGHPKDFDRWIAEHSRLVAEFRANRGPEDNSVRIYLHAPEVGRESAALVRIGR